MQSIKFDKILSRTNVGSWKLSTSATNSNIIISTTLIHWKTLKIFNKTFIKFLNIPESNEERFKKNIAKT